MRALAMLPLLLSTVLLTLFAAAVPAAAHETTRSYLELQRNGADIDAKLRLAFRDIEVVIWLDADLDGRLLWGEVQPRLDALNAYVAARLQFDAGGACTFRPLGAAVSREGGLAYLDFLFSADCPDEGAPLTLTSKLFSDVDPGHRLFLTASDATRTTTAVVASEPVTLASGAGFQEAFADYLSEGVMHLLGGADHLVFLLVLILPAAAGSGPLRPRILSVIAAVTGFTIAHALTLTAAATDLLRPPPALIEALIAGSILITAADNVRPFLPGPRAAPAAFFGTIHGFGFAGALSALPLNGPGFALALLGFNLGIEVAQIGIVLCAMPALAMIGGGHRTVAIGSGGAAILALVWLWQRFPVMT